MIRILDIEITKEEFPNLYRMAEKNPEWLSAQLRGWAKIHGDGDLAGAATLLESDLQHEYALGKEEVAELADFFDLLARFDHEDRQKGSAK